MKDFFKRMLGYGFYGGPDAHSKRSYKALLNNDILEFYLPCANPMQFPLVFPYQQPGWFELHAEHGKPHYVCINQQQYWYNGHILKTHGEPLGKFKLTIRLEKVCAGQKLRRHDLTQLAQYLRQTMLPQCYNLVHFGNQPWLHYTDSQQTAYRQYHYYSYPLSAQFYLVISFAYKVNLPAYFHYWRANADTAQHNIMRQTRLRLSDR